MHREPSELWDSDEGDTTADTAEQTAAATRRKVRSHCCVGGIYLFLVETQERNKD